MWRVKREEWPLGIVVLILLGLLNILLVCKYFGVFAYMGDDYRQVLSSHFHVSGFDAITYSVLTEWGMKYDVMRHSLLPYMMYLPCQLNQWLMTDTGANCAVVIVALMQWVCGFYAYLFLYRILREVVGLCRLDTSLLTLFFFSFAFVMLTFIAPDHFGLSLTLILLALYLFGRAIRTGVMPRPWQTVVLFVVTSGVTLTNGAKVLVADWFTRGWRFFRWRHLLLVVFLPSVLMVGLSLWENRIYVYPQEQAQKQKWRTHRKEMLAKARADHQKYKNAPWVIHKGVPYGTGSLLRWTDKTTSRPRTLVENVFGESFQFHSDHMIEDVLVFYRPVLLRYRWWFNYAAEAVLVLLFAVGIAAGFRQRFLWMCLTGITGDIAMHLGLGFGINEVYIFSAHWVYVVPVAVAYGLLRLSRRWLFAARMTVLALTAYLYVYNLWLLCGWLSQPIVVTKFS